MKDIKSLMLCFILLVQWVVAQDKPLSFDREVMTFIRVKLADEEKSLKTYHHVKDKLSETPVAPYEEYFNADKFKSLPIGIKQSVQQIKLFRMFLADDFHDVTEVNGILKKYVTFSSKVDSECNKAKELLIRKRNMNRLSWAKCENDTKALENKAWKKKRDAYWKIMEKFFSKYKL